MLALVGLLLACNTPKPADWASYGAAPTLATAKPATDLLAHPDTFVGSTVRVEGTVSDVCSKAGCWLVLADDQGRAMRVTMKDHSFGVPKDCTGQRADIEGTVVGGPTDPEKVEHYESEGGPAPEKGTAEHVELVATGVRLQARI